MIKRPHIQKVIIRNFLGIDLTGIELNLSDRFTVLAGPNNSGKTAILTALETWMKVWRNKNTDGQKGHVAGSITNGVVKVVPNGYSHLQKNLFFDRDKPIEYEFLITVPIALVSIVPQWEKNLSPGQSFGMTCKGFFSPKNETPYFELNLPEVRDNSFAQEMVKFAVQAFSEFIFFPANRKLSSGPEKDVVDIYQLAQGQGVSDWVRRASNPDPDSNADHKILLEFERQAAEFLGSKNFELRVNHGNTNELMVKMDGNEFYSLDKLGFGIRESILILLVVKLARTLDKKISLVAVDEPELHLHPKLQRKLMKFFAGNGIQLLLTTHSTSIVDSANKLGGLIYETRSISDGESKRNITLSAVKTDLALSGLYESVGVSISDVIQVDGIVWVEGLNDVGVFNHWINKCPEVKNKRVLVLPLGENVINNPDFDFGKLASINPNTLIFLDSEKLSMESSAIEPRKKIKEKYGDLIHLTERKCLENYFSIKALKETYSRFPDVVEFDFYKSLVSQLTGFSKGDNSSIAWRMGWPEIKDTDLGIRILSYLKTFKDGF